MSKIALVDDDRNILTSVSMTLEAEGFEVETYNDGQAALDAFNKKMPDMAVLDITADIHYEAYRARGDAPGRVTRDGDELDGPGNGQAA